MSETSIPSAHKEQLVISATTSERRDEALKQLEEKGVETHSHPGPASELDSPNVALVAKNKSDYLKGVIDESIERSSETGLMETLTPALISLIMAIEKYGEEFKVISADTKTYTYEMSRDGKQRFFDHGKPESAEEVQKMVDRMLKTKQAVYRVFSGSHLADYHRGKPYPVETRDGQVITVRLKPDMLMKLTRDEGMRRYLQVFEEFYSSDVYRGNNLTRAVEVTDLSGGFSLPVFFKDGAVETLSLDGGREFTPSEISDKLLKQLIFGVAVGYSPRVLDQIMPGAYEFIIDNWQWLRDVVANIREGREK
ncbi:Maf family protein [Microgenomates group bacterium]|nr:Maf family protein [Microgenomates group bacterium]